MGIVDDVFDFLETEGIAGGSTEWSLLRRRSADVDVEDQLVVVTEDGGPAPEIPAEDGIGDAALYDVGVLVSVRASQWDSDASASKAQEIFAALHGQRNITVGTVTYLRARARTPQPIFVGFDEEGRPTHTIAFLLLQEATISS